MISVLGCSTPAEKSAWQVVYLDSPSESGSGMPNLTAANGHVYMSWLEVVPEGGHVLLASEWNGSRWTLPATITFDVPFFVNWADFPSLLVMGNRYAAAHWLQKSGVGSYAYDVMIALSKDGGNTWSKGVSPHRDGTQNEHGFVSLVERGPGQFSAVWLDGRKFQKGAEEDLSNETMLMFADYENGGFQPEIPLDYRVCDCCQTATAKTNDGIFVAYRDRSDSEVRDISYACYKNGKWSEPRTLYPDGWQIAGCPVNGPAASSVGNKIAVVWFTGAGANGRVQAIFSEDGGETFGRPIRVDQGNPVGRVDVEWLNGGSALVSWLENQEKGAEIRIREIHPDGTAEPYFVVAASSSSRASGFPRMAPYEDGVLIAWTDAGDPQRVLVANLKHIHKGSRR